MKLQSNRIRSSNVNGCLLIAICVMSFLLGSCNSPKNKSESKPNQTNVLLILVDDLGFSDLGCYGGEINTPNIDQLASEGLRLRQCYNNGMCAPSRASLLTGKYPHQVGMGFFNMDLKEPGYEGYLKNEPTLASLLKDQGYQTFISGKWHLGNEHENWPLQRGFDRFFGFIDGGSSYFDDTPIMKVVDDHRFVVDSMRVPLPDPNMYLTDFLTDRGIQFLDEKNHDDPFFLFMSYNAPHWPLHAKSSDMEKYEGAFNKGWDVLRQERLERLKSKGIINENASLSLDGNVPEWESLSYEKQQEWAQKMEVYAAMVDNLDQNIGRLTDYLKEKKELDNTLILFVSDNGAEDWDISRIPVFVKSKEGSKIGGPGSNESYGKPWAHLGNTPLRQYKSSPYEGAIRSPFIARYPGVITPNTVADGGIHFIDFLPTILSFIGTDVPADKEKVKGEDFSTLLKGQEWKRSKPLFLEWGGNKSVHMDQWKALSIYPENEWMLFNLEDDLAESFDQSKNNEEVLKKLKIKYEKWKTEIGVVSWNEEIQRRTGFPPGI